jgi:hypothetical protein
MANLLRSPLLNQIRARSGNPPASHALREPGISYAAFRRAPQGSGVEVRSSRRADDLGRRARPGDFDQAAPLAVEAASAHEHPARQVQIHVERCRKRRRLRVLRLREPLGSPYPRVASDPSRTSTPEGEQAIRRPRRLTKG